MVTNTITSQVADKVAAAVTRAGRSKLSIANETGIPLSTFTRKINGHTDFTVAELDAVARSLGINASRFLPDSFLSSAA